MSTRGSEKARQVAAAVGTAAALYALITSGLQLACRHLEVDRGVYRCNGNTASFKELAGKVASMTLPPVVGRASVAPMLEPASICRVASSGSAAIRRPARSTRPCTGRGSEGALAMVLPKRG